MSDVESAVAAGYAAGKRDALEGQRPIVSARSVRLCRYYCNAMRAGGIAGPLCAYCAHCDFLVSFWSRVFNVDGERS